MSEGNPFQSSRRVRRSDVGFNYDSSLPGHSEVEEDVEGFPPAATPNTSKNLPLSVDQTSRKSKAMPPPPSLSFTPTTSRNEARIGDLERHILAQNKSIRNLTKIMTRVLKERNTPVIVSPSPRSPTLPPNMRYPSEAPTNVTAAYRPQRTAKINDPRKFDSKDTMPYEEWETEIYTKLAVNGDHFETEEARMYLVFNSTEGEARTYVFPRYKQTAADRFTSHQEMLQFLRAIYINPYQQEEAKVAYQSLTMNYSDTFHAFRSKFQNLADKAEIPAKDRVSDIFGKLHVGLQQALAVTRFTVKGDFNLFCDLAGGVDSELRRMRQTQREAALRKASTNAPSGAYVKTRLAETRLVENRLATENRPAETRLATETRPETRPAPYAATRPTTAAAATLRKEVFCFNCNKPGHFAKDCIVPRRVGINQIEDTVDQVDAQVAEEGESEQYEDVPQSGNEDA